MIANRSTWEPPAAVALPEVLELNEQVLALPDQPIVITEDIFRIQVLAMEWDIGAVIYEPQDKNKIPVGPDDKKVGVFLLHGGVSDFKSVERIAKTLASKFAVKVATMTFPGRFYFLDASRDWPGDVEYDDGTARTPLWSKETRITKDQYTIVQDTSKREEYGTLVSLSAKGRHGVLLPHGRVARRFRSGGQRNRPAAISRKRVLDLYARPFHRRAVCDDGIPARG